MLLPLPLASVEDVNLACSGKILSGESVRIFTMLLSVSCSKAAKARAGAPFEEPEPRVAVPTGLGACRFRPRRARANEPPCTIVWVGCQERTETTSARSGARER